MFGELDLVHYTVLLSSFLLPFSCTSWCSCSLPCISQILQVRFFSSSVLSFCRTDQGFLQWPSFFFFRRCLSRISPTVSVTTVLKVVIIVSISVSLLFMMVRGANFLPFIDWKVSNTLGSFSFLRSTCLPVCLWIKDPHNRAPKKNTSHGNEVLPPDTLHPIQRPWYQRGRPCQDSAGNRATWRLPDLRKETQTTVAWSYVPLIRSGQNHLARHSERGKKTRQTEEEVGRQHQEMDSSGVRQVPEGNEGQWKMEETGCEIICGAKTSLAVKG